VCIEKKTKKKKDSSWKHYSDFSKKESNCCYDETLNGISCRVQCFIILLIISQTIEKIQEIYCSRSRAPDFFRAVSEFHWKEAHKLDKEKHLD